MFHDKSLWKLAYEMARSGDYANVIMIERELARRGQLAGEQLTSNVLKRELLTRVCHSARRGDPMEAGLVESYFSSPAFDVYGPELS